jgi:hypothetical protein
MSVVCKPSSLQAIYGFKSLSKVREGNYTRGDFVLAEMQLVPVGEVEG